MMGKCALLFLLALVQCNFSLHIRTKTIITTTWTVPPTTTTLTIPLTTTKTTSTIPPTTTTSTIPLTTTTSTIPPTTTTSTIPPTTTTSTIPPTTTTSTIPPTTTTSTIPPTSTTSTIPPTTTTSTIPPTTTTSTIPPTSTTSTIPPTTSLQKLTSNVTSPNTKIYTFVLKEKNAFEETLLLHKEAFVDKTMFISDLISLKHQFQLITRPSRWAKTFNMDMLQKFFDIAHNKTGAIDEEMQELHETYFKGGVVMIKSRLKKYPPERCVLTPLAVSYNSTAMAHLRRHPVIYLSLADMGETLGNFRRNLIEKISLIIESKSYNQFLVPYCDYEILTSSVSKDHCVNLLQNPRETLLRDERMLNTSLATLASLLRCHFESTVVILVDEYDFSLNRMLNKKEFNLFVQFLTSFFTQTFKFGAPSILFRGIVTGILQFSSAQISSGVAPVERFSIFDDPYATHFGFTESEVETLLEKNPNSFVNMREIKRWYDGYFFGNNRQMFNPQSIRKLITSGIFNNYWASSCPLGSLQTTEDAILHVLSTDVYQTLYQQLYTNHVIYAALNPLVDVDTAMKNKNQFLSLLTSMGYTTFIKTTYNSYNVFIPNKEVRGMFKHRIPLWATEHIRSLTLDDESATFDLIMKQMSRDFVNWNLTAVELGVKYMLSYITPNVTCRHLCNVMYGLLLDQDQHWGLNRTFLGFPALGPLKSFCHIMLFSKSNDDTMGEKVVSLVIIDETGQSGIPNTISNTSTQETPDTFSNTEPTEETPDMFPNIKPKISSAETGRGKDVKLGLQVNGNDVNVQVGMGKNKRANFPLGISWTSVWNRTCHYILIVKNKVTGSFLWNAVSHQVVSSVAKKVAPKFIIT